MNDTELIKNTLLELRIAAKRINSEEQLKQTMYKYDMLIVGEKLNVVYALELLSYLNREFDKNVDKDEFLKLIPGVCESLSMKLEHLVLLENTNKTANYSIELF